MHQVVKFYAWEEAFVSRLKGKRLEEAAHLSVFWCYKAAIVALTVLGNGHSETSNFHEFVI